MIGNHGVRRCMPDFGFTHVMFWRFVASQSGRSQFFCLPMQERKKRILPPHFLKPYRQLNDFERGRIALSECVKLDGHTEQYVVTCNVHIQLRKDDGSNGYCEELIDEMKTFEGQEAQMRDNIGRLFNKPEQL
ncbi:hypothetical protein TNCV_1293531 [Trichonephila clavipes]|nr:hypothetical protein TNCV_1293531 [Trichonephila clavipes]